MPLEETEYRKLVQETLNRVERAFDSVDPDVAECEQAHGALTIRFADSSRCILSAQPSVRQLWLALAARGTAYHFDFVPASDGHGEGHWMDDKGRSVELFSFLENYMKETAGLAIRF